MTWIEGYAERRSAKDAKFRGSHEEEKAILDLVRAREQANLTQKNVATR